MPLTAGSTLGHYEILSPLGAGGMGEVYRARDTKLGREVAVKTLHDELSADPERLARFEREARVLASLNHPNVATLFGFERQGETSFLVMELVEGETLADRIARRSLSVGEAIDTFIRIAEGLEAAHERGVIHRDLKPANIKVLARGGVKILDFGLAKGRQPQSGGDADLSHSPTLALAATQRGQILGTAGYMSPEQATGKAVDKRSDIWAFGVCLWEALAGRRAFGGDSMAATLARVLEREPEWKHLPNGLPWRVREVLRRCLVKDPSQRLHDIADARIELQNAAAQPDAFGIGDPANGPPRRGVSWVWMTATAVLVAALTGLALWKLKPGSPPPLVRAVLSAPPSAPLLSSPLDIDLAVTPDGGAVVYQAAGSLYLRPVDELQGIPVRGTEQGSDPFVSPDGAWIGFVDGTAVKKVSRPGGSPLLICEAPGAVTNASWEEDDTIFFGVVGGGLYRVAAAGGEPELLAEPDAAAGEFQLIWPTLLPGGRVLVFTAAKGLRFEDAQVDALVLETGERKTLLQGAGRTVYVATGHLVYAAEDGLRAVAFDPSALVVSGEPVRVLEGVVTKEGSKGADFALAGNGSLVYASGSRLPFASGALVWVDREGGEKVLSAPPGFYLSLSISPDGDSVAISEFTESRDVWLWDLRRGTRARLTRGLQRDNHVLWTPSGQGVIFSSEISPDDSGFFRMPANGTGEAERLGGQIERPVPTSIYPDGRLLLYHSGPPGRRDVGVLELDGGRSRPLLTGDFDELNAALSPDGRFLAYQSNESGRYEIWVRSFPEVGAGRWGPISTSGGSEPLWSPDGSELFYRAGNLVMAVPIRADPAFVPGSPRQLFAGDYAAADWSLDTGPGGRRYDIHPDGERFLMIKPWSVPEEETPSQVVLVLNWLAELKRLVPTD